jgi:putative addiction module CopG family antidote
MNITLTPEQTQFIQGQLATGHYQSSTEVLQAAFDLLAAQDWQQDPAWISEVSKKIEAAEASIARGEGSSFDDAMAKIFDRFQEAKEQQG